MNLFKEKENNFQWKLNKLSNGKETIQSVIHSLI